MKMISHADDGTELVYLSVNTNGSGRPGDTMVRLSNGQALGHVQAISWDISVGEVSTCTVKTILDPVEFKTLSRDVFLHVRPGHGYHPLRYLWDWYSYRLWHLFTR